jgi:ubiquinone/menaquinone biosynthesis C-methylase UbiE
MAAAGETDDHYARPGLAHLLLQALAAAGRDSDRLQTSDLAAFDEFHLGGHTATRELCAALEPVPGARVLDVGSGLGGTARHLAQEYGCEVTGLEPCADYAQAATVLTQRTGLDSRVRFVRAGAPPLPFADASFDAATLVHVGMNVADKAALFTELARVVRPGGRLGIYDVMGDAPSAGLRYPLPWATAAERSFVVGADTYARALQAAGWRLMQRRSRGGPAREALERMLAGWGQASAPTLGLHLLRGSAAQEEFANLLWALEQGSIEPMEWVASRG